MNNSEKIGRIEAIALFVTLTTNQIIFNVPNVLLLECGVSAWLNLIYVSIFAFIFLILVCKFMEAFPGLDIIDISHYLGGNFLKNTIAFLYMLFFLLFSALTLRYFATSLKLIYFESTPISLILIFFIIPSFIINKFGFKAISGVNLILMPFTLLSIIVLVLFTISDFVPQSLFPIFGNGLKATFFSGFTNIFCFTGFAYLYFLNPLLKDSNKLKNVGKISLVISGIYLLFSVISLIMSFSYSTFTDTLLSFYTLSRLVQFSEFLQRIDAVFILLWILALLSFLSLMYFFTIYCFKKIFKIQDENSMLYALSSILFSLCLIPEDVSYLKFLGRYIYKYVTLILVFLISFIILLLAFWKSKRKEKV